MSDFRINDPVQAEKILANGQGGMVGMTRALIADPELPNKAREGRLDEIRYCIACDQGCFGRIFKGKPLTCLQNATAGLEKEIGTLAPARLKKRVLVVGGGPAGMETARVARLRGHEVVLYEKEQEVGRPGEHCRQGAHQARVWRDHEILDQTDGDIKGESKLWDGGNP